MRRRRQTWGSCHPISKLNGLVLFLFVVFLFIWDRNGELPEFLHHDTQLRQPREHLSSADEESSANLRASPQVAFEESIKRGPGGDEKESMTNAETFVVSTVATSTDTVSKQATTPSSCSGPVDPRAEVSIWIPESPDRSIPSRLEKSIHRFIMAENRTKDRVEGLCPLPTSQVKIINKCPYWILHTFDVNGNPKTVGGDEFYVTFHHGPLSNSTAALRRPPPAAVAKVQDFSNGTYQLDFVESPFVRSRYHWNGPGTITVTFQYTCGIGAWNPPSKARWKSSGAIAVTHSHYPVQFPPPMKQFVSSTILHNNVESLNEPTSSSSSKGPHQIRVFLDWMDQESAVPDDSNSTMITNETGGHMYREPVLLAFGDSLMQQFVKSWKQTEIPNVGMPLNTTTIHDWMELFQRRVGPKLKSLTSGSKTVTRTVALIVGSSTWDLLEPNSDDGWEDHASAMKTLIDFIHQKYWNSENSKSHLRLFWKSPTAMHIHIPILENKELLFQQQTEGDDFPHKLHSRIKYMSSSRSHELYTVQKKVCALLQIPFLDVFELSYLSAYRTQMGDGRHYDEKFNRYALESFFKYNGVEHFWLRYQSKLAHNTKESSNRILRVRYCPNSWVDTIQAVLLAAVTNRQLELDLEEYCDKWKNYQPFLLEASLVRFQNSPPTTISNNKKKNVVTLDERLPFPLSLDALLEGGWIPNNIGSPSYQVATEAFDKGTSYLYGMIWHNVLSKTLGPLQNDDPDTDGHSVTHDPNHHNSLVLSVHNDIADNGQGDIRKCMSRLQGGNEALEKIECRVFIASEQAIQVWEGGLRQDFNCTAELLPSSTATASLDREKYYKGNETMVWQQANEIAKVAKDGYIARCEDDSDRLFNSLVDYIRTKEAKAMDHMPIIPISCCL